MGKVTQRLGPRSIALIALMSGGVAAADSFPVSIPHIFGTTEIAAPPTRVVSVSFIGHDFLLALGVVPVGLRKWYGVDPYGVWVWAQDDLGEATPTVMQGELDVEQIALLEPDLIVGQWSGMTERDHRLLSLIAPTLAPMEGAGDYGMGWRDMLLRLGLATGTRDAAEDIVSRLDQRFAEIRAEHPAWQGAEAAMVWSGSMGAYTSRDIRGQFLEALGFTVPDDIDARIAGNPYFVTVPTEDYTMIDADALIWLDTGGTVAALRDLPLRFTMRAYREGREIYSDPLLSAALSHSSPQSLAFALDRLVPLLEAATDGDPTTPVPSMVDVGLAP